MKEHNVSKACLLAFTETWLKEHDLQSNLDIDSLGAPSTVLSRKHPITDTFPCSVSQVGPEKEQAGKTVSSGWTEESIRCLQDCFFQMDWELFRVVCVDLI